MNVLTNSIVKAREEMQFWATLVKSGSISKAWDSIEEKTNAVANATNRAAGAQRNFNDAVSAGRKEIDRASQLLKTMQEEINLFGTEGHTREAIRLGIGRNITAAQSREFVRLKDILEALNRESKERDRVRAGLPPPGFAGRFGPPEGAVGPIPFGPRRPIRPLELPAMGGDGASASVALATRAVDATGSNSISSELSARQATEAERSRIQEKILEEMKRGNKINADGFKLLESRIEDDVPFEIGG